MTNSEKKILIGISSCLLGENVRYDGVHKRSELIIKSVCSQFNCLSICPEVAIGLGTPRPPMAITANGSIQLVDKSYVNDAIAQKLIDFADHIAISQPNLCGYIFKARSPSCGINDVPVFGGEQKYRGKTGTGIYNKHLTKHFIHLPICDETQLQSAAEIEIFITKVKHYYYLFNNRQQQ